MTGEKHLNLADAYDPPDGTNRSSSTGASTKQTGYRTRSMLVVPMENAEGETIGVLQLINKKTQSRGNVLDAPDELRVTPACCRSAR